MGQVVSTSFTRRSMVAELALTAAPVTVLAGADNAHAQAKQTMPEKSLKTRSYGNGTPRTWEGCPVSSSCGRCGSATFRVGPSSSRPPSPARRRSALRRPTETSGSLRQNSMRVAAELGRTLDFFKVPTREKTEVLAAFAAWEVGFSVTPTESQTS
jgi:hemoglobin